MYEKDRRIVITLDAGGTNFVFGAVQGDRFVVEPITLPSNSDRLDRCLETMVEGFRTVIGRLPESSQIAYAMCCGDNGILYAEAAGRLLLQQYQGIDDHELGLFSPHREWRVKR